MCDKGICSREYNMWDRDVEKRGRLGMGVELDVTYRPPGMASTFDSRRRRSAMAATLADASLTFSRATRWHVSARDFIVLPRYGW